MKILSVIGTRPEAIKMAPVIQELERYSDRVDSIICVTGQHRQMLDQVLDLFHIRPDFDLDLMRPNQTLSELTATLFSKLDVVIHQTRPDWILAQGDTTTVMVAAIIAFYHKIKFGHVEAGLRTGNLNQPFPEEMNRRTADSLAHLRFAPTEQARQALLCEGYADNTVLVTGNTVIDALLTVAGLDYDWAQGPVPQITPEQQLVLVTAHRRESFGEPFREICLALKELAHYFAESPVQFVYPVHLNPNVRAPVQEILSGLQNVHLIEPVDYLTLVNLIKRATLILTDSGGIQEEAPSLGVPVLVLRDTTERPEGIAASVVKLVGTQRHCIIQETIRLLENSHERALMSTKVNPYGDGKAAVRIVNRILVEEMCHE